MSRKKRRSRNYDITGIVEVIYLTPGNRKTTLLNFDKEPTVENTEVSGSIVTKTPIYEGKDKISE